MASEFYNATHEEERKDWRQHHMTQLAIKMLIEFREESEREIFSSARVSVEKANDMLGFRRGIQECIELLERE